MSKIIAANLLDVSDSDIDTVSDTNAEASLKYNLEAEADEFLNNEVADRYKLVQFHPAYNYDDFVIGVSVDTDNGNISYSPRNGVIKEIAEKAAKAKKESEDMKKSIPSYVLIIDEINRAPLSSVMGELLYALEKRGEEVSLPAMNSGNDAENTVLMIPDNLYIIGTMNTADHSLNSMDYAMRRRFSFVNINSKEPEQNLLKQEGKSFDSKLYNKVSELFNNKEGRGILVAGVNPEDIKLGSSYFIYKDKEMEYKLKYEIIPMLREYYKDGFFQRKKRINGEMVRDIFLTEESLLEYLHPQNESSDNK